MGLWKNSTSKKERERERERKKGKSYLLFSGLLSSYIDLLSDVQKPQTQNSLEFCNFFFSTSGS